MLSRHNVGARRERLSRLLRRAQRSFSITFFRGSFRAHAAATTPDKLPRPGYASLSSKKRVCHKAKLCAHTPDAPFWLFVFRLSGAQKQDYVSRVGCVSSHLWLNLMGPIPFSHSKRRLLMLTNFSACVCPCFPRCPELCLQNPPFLGITDVKIKESG